MIPDVADYPKLGSWEIWGNTKIDNFNKKPKNSLKLSILLIPNILYYLKSSSGKAPCIKNASFDKKPRFATFRFFCPPTLAAQPLCVFFPSFILLNPCARTLSSNLLLGKNHKKTKTGPRGPPAQNGTWRGSA